MLRKDPRFGVVVFPGSNCEQDVRHALTFLGYQADYIWHQDTSLAGFDAVILPGGFSYGDYLRCGAVARFSPVMQAVVDFAGAGGPVMGICNGFQILTEAHLLPGALLRNKNLKFICEQTMLRVEESVCSWVNPDDFGKLLSIPINHGEGNFFCDDDTLDSLRANGQIVVRYAAPDGSSPEGQAPNGALDNIAGICNGAGNVFGLMPHPERVTDGLGGNTDGQVFFAALVERMAGMR